ncbi:Potassium transporter Kup [Candidatus Bealeia paramacronuclearis]|uniref:Probable potassium transport system protein Kup n=2 Tax=Candidatus Bealeia paramacronuclearis TaxID=1921001 RepID=A0ABZ2C3B8_9PROT|nr:Potassium transporter Kup [Candidatus Bealeia paramacronuclearis]
MPLLMMGALGIVYGDIGTSPLYAIRECLNSLQVGTTPENILGILSLVFWSITLIVSLKYVVLIMRADNHGEGGILALLTLAISNSKKKKSPNLLMLGLLGAALFLGDGIITPAISVLSALEGLSVISPTLTPFILPLSILVLILLFWYQEKGTGQIGVLFGPIMLVWFFTIGLLGIFGCLHHPEVFQALNPLYAISFLIHHSWGSFATLGAVVLALTGAEALYADMGHFGPSPIRRSWFGFVYPSLILNYFGQGAVLLHYPEALTNPFYFLAPTWGLIPMVILSTAATIIASQALISGVFSVTWQAIQLNYLPRMHVLHTSHHHIGQVYVSMMNWIFLTLIILVVLMFKNSTALASAYGFAVTGLMMITTILTGQVAQEKWGWPPLVAYLVFLPFLFIDIVFFSATSLKVLDGAWFPMLLGGIAFLIMSTWYKGRNVLQSHAEYATFSYEDLLEMLKEAKPLRVAGNAIYMTSSPGRIPSSFTINYKHNKVIHERLIFLSIIIENVPHIHSKNRVTFEKLGEDVFRVRATYGFMEVPNITAITERCKAEGLYMDPEETTVFLTRGIPFATVHPQMPKWRSKLYILLAKNAMSATEFFRIPYARVIELGARWRL